MARATPMIPPPQTEILLGDDRCVRIGAQVGRGSMATVYRGTYESPFAFRRSVAVKVFDVIASDEHDVVLAALANAARRSGAVRHPNVVHIEDFGLVAPAQPYALEELVEGCSLEVLAEHCARRHERLPLDLALFIGIEIAEALAGARLACSPDGVRLGVVHGELSTSDVLLSFHGEVKVSDFAIAAAARAASSVRSVRALARRVRTLAPEVARGQIGDARSDVFSLGVVLREMLVGPRFPPSVSDSEALVWARDGMVHQAMFEPQLPPELHALIVRALERDPTRRFPHAGVLGYELRRVALTMGVGDGRPFLRSALARTILAEGDGEGDDVTSELRATTPPPPTPRASGVASVDRFARLRGEAGAGEPDGGAPHGEGDGHGEALEGDRVSDVRLQSGTLPVAGASDDEEDDVEVR